MIRDSIIPADYPNFDEFGPTPCSKVDPDAFFSVDPITPSISNRPDYPREREAKLVCSACPYQLRCLEYALKNQDMLGIWGGTTEQDRKRLRKRARRSLSSTPSR